MNLKNKKVIIKTDSKPIVIHHTNELTLGGTEKLIQINMPYYISDDVFDHYLAYKSDGDLTREEHFVNIMGREKMISYSSENEFVSKVSELKPFILHRYSAGIPEFPFVPEVKKHTNYFVSTSTFGDQDDTIDIEKVIYVSNHIRKLRGKHLTENHVVVRIPVEIPHSNEDLRAEFGIPEDAFVFGRIGRDTEAIYQSIAIEAFSKLEEQRDNVHFLAVAPSELLKKDVEKFGIKNFHFIDRTTDNKRISSFYNTIDVLAHSRRDGECNPLNIWEAFSHGKPVISHYAFPYNGHIEAISDCGLIVGMSRTDDYLQCMLDFVDGVIDYEKMSDSCIKRWKATSTPQISSKDHLDNYKDILQKEQIIKNGGSLWG